MKTLNLILLACALMAGACGDDDSDGGGGDTDSDSDSDTDTDTDTDTDSDTDSDSDSDTDSDTDDTINFSGSVSIDSSVTGGSGFLCVGLYATECPSFTGPLGDPIDGTEVGGTTLTSPSMQQLFDFEVDGVADEDYGLAAGLFLTPGVSDCEDLTPASGDLFGCTPITVAGGADVADVDILLDIEIP